MMVFGLDRGSRKKGVEGMDELSPTILEEVWTRGGGTPAVVVLVVVETSG